MNINNNDSTMKLLKLGLDASSLRGETIANNMANVNTEDYKKSYVKFEENLSNEINKISLKKTRVEHLNGSSDSDSALISVEQDNSTSMRTDGNNVDIDTEQAYLADNQIKYYTLLDSMTHEFNRLKSVLNQ